MRCYSGSGWTVRRWSRVRTRWSRRTARRGVTASSSPTCCCSAAPALTARCTASAPAATTWRARWRCAKHAYSTNTHSDGGGEGAACECVCLKHPSNTHTRLLFWEKLNIHHIYCFPRCWERSSRFPESWRRRCENTWIKKGSFITAPLQTAHIRDCCPSVCSEDAPTPP